MQRELTDTIVCDDADFPSTGVVVAVAEALDLDPADLDVRLGDVVDPDALDRLFCGRRGSATERPSVTFSMAGCEVVVRPDGTVTATPQSTDRTA